MITEIKIKLREKKLSDALDDFSWRADPELAKLDAAPILTLTLPEYLSSYAAELRYPSPTKHPFAIETSEGKHIGNCAYYNISKFEGEAELGIMIGDRGYWDKGYGTDAVTTLVDYIFRNTKLNRIHLKTLKSNQRAQRCFEKCGFSPYRQRKQGRYNFVLMEIYRQQWEEA